jgi:hypothetical protein
VTQALNSWSSGGFHPRPRGFPTELPSVWDASTLLNNTILTLRSDLGEIDLLAEIAGLGGFQNVKQNAISLEAESLPETEP